MIKIGTQVNLDGVPYKVTEIVLDTDRISVVLETEWVLHSIPWTDLREMLLDKEAQVEGHYHGAYGDPLWKVKVRV